MRGRLTSAFLYSLAAMPLAAVALYAKWLLLGGGGARMAERMAGRPPGGLTRFEYFSLLLPDIAVALGAAPILVVVLAMVSPRRARPYIVGFTVATLIALLFVQVRSLATVGAPMSFDMLATTLKFGLERPDLIGNYLPLRSTLLHLGAVVATIALAIREGRFDRQEAGPRSTAMARHRLVAAGTIVSVLATTGFARPLPAEAYEGALLTKVLRAFVENEDALDHDLTRLSPPELVEHFRTIAGSRLSPPDPRFFGRARDFNFVVMMMETIPSACMEMTESLDDMPAFKRLRSRAFVSRQHYSTTSYSTTSNFATLSGWYPPTNPSAFVGSHPEARASSLFWALRDRGYHTSLYEPGRARYENDPEIYRTFGVANEVDGSEYVKRSTRPSGWPYLAAADSAAFDRLLSDVRGWLAEGSRFATYFVPEIAHGPWHDPIAGRNASLMERCRSLVAIHDGWLGQLIALLDQHKALEKTIIVVTADHGLRTIEEDPELRPGIITDRSFRVPLLFFLPQVLDSTTVLSSVTSSIDLTATAAELFGLDRSAVVTQGSTFWDPALPERRTFMLAKSYLGADVYHERGRFLGWNWVSGRGCVSMKKLICGPADALPAGHPLNDTIQTTLKDLKATQLAWLEQFVRTPSDSSATPRAR